jgi:glycosyltransferase involved in cell wall biosynthesis
MAPTPAWKRAIKKPLLGSMFRRVDHFLCIGTANRDLYRSYGVPESKLHIAPYAVDNERFVRQAEQIRELRTEIREQWGIPESAYVVLFCGKFISKKRPLDLIKAAQLLLEAHPEMKIHLLFAGSGELGAAMRKACNIVFDADASQRSEFRDQRTDNRSANGRIRRGEEQITDNQKPRASFAGFLNQTEISKAYVAADVLVLPSDYSETWGLVVNEAMASGLTCIISDRCGCARDLGKCVGNGMFECANIKDLAEQLSRSIQTPGDGLNSVHLPSFETTAAVVAELYDRSKFGNH